MNKTVSNGGKAAGPPAGLGVVEHDLSVADTAPESRHRYSLPLYIAQIGVGIALLGVFVWALLQNHALLSLYTIGVLLVGWVLWRSIYEVYKSPREIAVSESQVRIRTFDGRTRVLPLRSLRCSTRRNPFYGSYDVSDESGRLVFRLYVWMTKYGALRDLIQRESGNTESASGDLA